MSPKHLVAVIAGSLIKLAKYNATDGYQIEMICHHDEVVKFDSIAITQNDRLLFSILSTPSLTMIHKNTYHVHTRDFECAKCSKSFEHKSVLQVHVKIVHQGERDFQCDECSTFLTKKVIWARTLKLFTKKSKSFNVTNV